MSLTWNPQDFCNISNLNLPMDTLWSPYIHIYEQVDEEKTLGRNFLSIMHSGSTHTTQQHHVTIACNLEMYKFPFDNQKCNITIFPFVYAEDITLLSNKTTEDVTKESKLFHLTDGEWKFTNINIITYGEAISVITYEISVKRRSILYVLNLIFPTCALYLLDMAVLFSTTSGGDKISFQLSLSVGESVLAVILQVIIPTSSDDPPLIVTMFIGVFVLMILGILETSLLMQLKKKPLHPLLKALKLLKHPNQPRTTSGDLLSKQGDSLTEMAAGREERRDSKRLGKGNTEPPVLMERTNSAEQQTETQAEPQEQESALQGLEKALFYGHLLFSLLFTIIIIIQWRS